MATQVFLPGTLCDERVWQPVASKLAVLLENEPANVTSQQFIDFAGCDSIRAMAQHALAATTGQLIPIGLSMGGMVALEMWRQAPARIAALVLCDTDPSCDTSERQAVREGQQQCAHTNGIGAMAETLCAKYFAPDTAETLNALNQTVVAMALKQGVSSLLAQHNALQNRGDYWETLPQITVPVLVLCGESDTICPPATHARMVDSLSNARYKIITNAAHLAPLQQPVQTAKIMAEWLSAQK